MNLEQIKQICLQELGNVEVIDLGFVAPGIHQYKITVGTKENPGYQQTIDPNSALFDKENPNKSLGTPMMNDERILQLNGTEDINAIVLKLKLIKDTMPENRVIPTAQPMATASNKPIEAYYAPPAPTTTPADEEVNRQIQDNKIVNNVPQPEPDKLQPFMDEVLSTLQEFRKEINELKEVKKEPAKMGRPKKTE